MRKCRASSVAHNEVYAVPAAGLVDESDDVVFKTQLTGRRKGEIFSFDCGLIKVVALSNLKVFVFIDFAELRTH